jgi:hypothetical protein
MAAFFFAYTTRHAAVEKRFRYAGVTCRQRRKALDPGLRGVTTGNGTRRWTPACAGVTCRQRHKALDPGLRRGDVPAKACPAGTRRYVT